jgi:hypothetical protein
MQERGNVLKTIFDRFRRASPPKIAGLLAVASLFALVMIDVATAAIEKRQVRRMITSLFAGLSVPQVKPERSFVDDEGQSIELYELKQPRAGFDMFLVDVELQCGAVSFVATDKKGEILFSSRDYRYLVADGPGKYRVAFSVYGNMVKADGYYFFIRYGATCAKPARTRLLKNDSASAWAGPPLLSAYRENGDDWIVIFAGGDQWITAPPKAEWIQRSINHGR